MLAMTNTPDEPSDDAPVADPHEDHRPIPTGRVEDEQRGEDHEGVETRGG